MTEILWQPAATAVVDNQTRLDFMLQSCCVICELVCLLGFFIGQSVLELSHSLLQRLTGSMDPSQLLHNTAMLRFGKLPRSELA